MQKRQFSKLLLSTLILCGFLQANLMADAAQFPTSTVNTDGSKFFKDDEGSTVKIDANGTKTIQKTDGTTVQVNPDGSKFIKDSDGTTITIDPKGVKTITKPDGSSIQVNPGK